MGKIAYLILAHQKPDICNALIDELLKDERSDVYLHVDVKFKNLEMFRSDVQQVARYNINWGGSAMVEATLELIRSACFKIYDRYVLLSGDSFPLRDIHKINDYLLSSPSIDYMEIYEGNLGERGFDRIFRYWIFQNHLNKFCWWVNKKAVMLQRKLKIVRKYPYDIGEFNIGSQWWALSHKSVCELLKKCDNRKFKSFIKHTKIPDEFFAQNAVTNLNLKPELMYYTFAFSPEGTYMGVKELTGSDFDECLKTQKMFARKVTMSFIEKAREFWR